MTTQENSDSQTEVHPWWHSGRQKTEVESVMIFEFRKTEVESVIPGWHCFHLPSTEPDDHNQVVNVTYFLLPRLYFVERDAEYCGTFVFFLSSRHCAPVFSLLPRNCVTLVLRVSYCPRGHWHIRNERSSPWVSRPIYQGLNHWSDSCPGGTRDGFDRRRGIKAQCFSSDKLNKVNL